ncbi:MAG TPA: hypothetical protein VNX46_04790 [Candidatus Acidoferrum sp.]|nr:hypothetical protein [Candidatus Acidoferrum sp.]
MNREELDQPSRDSEVAELKKQFEVRKKDWPSGFVAGQIKSVEFTNWNGMEVPLSFIFEDYNPTMHASGKLDGQYVCVITNISAATSADTYQPPILSRLAVDDARFRLKNNQKQLDFLQYWLATTNQWLADTDSKLTNDFLAALADPRTSGRYPLGSDRRKRFIVMAVVLLAAFSLPLFLYRQAQRVGQTK